MRVTTLAFSVTFSLHEMLTRFSNTCPVSIFGLTRTSIVMVPKAPCIKSPRDHLLRSDPEMRSGSGLEETKLAFSS